MTTSPRSVSRLRPSKLCRFLVCAVVFKLCLVGSFLFEPISQNLSLDVFLGRSAVPAVEETRDAFPSTRQLIAIPAAKAAEPEEKPEPVPAGNTLSREALQRRQDELARKEQDLRNLEKELDERLGRLEELELRLQAMLKQADETKNAKIRHLVDVLANMKAKQAAEVLETLDEKIAVTVLSGMRGRQAGEILSFVSSSKAARLSEHLARVQLPFE